MKKLSILLFSILFFTVSASYAQDSPVPEEESSAPFDVGADLVSKYVWRGLEFSSAPSVQPYLSFSTDLSDNIGLEIGAWGSYSFNGANDGSEADLYMSLSAGSFSFTVTDYFFPVDLTEQKYFDYGAHVFESSIGFEADKFSASVNYYFAGDAANDDIYLEIGYAASDNVSLTMGAGNESYTTDGNFNLTNIGLTYTKEIKSFPVFGSLILNPQRENIYLVFGVSF